MNTIICNKCFTPIYGGKMPYNIAQCGHIFCHYCLQQVKEQCFQCKYVNPSYVPLEEPLMPKKVSFYTPLVEILDTLLHIEMSRSIQLKITKQRFCELDNKYEAFKKQYFLTRRDIKIYVDKIKILKSEKEKLDKELLQMLQSTPKNISNTPKTLTNSEPTSTFSLNTRYSSDSLNYLNFSHLNLSDMTHASNIRSTDLRNQCKIDDNFLYTRGNNRPSRSTDFFVTSNIQNDSIITIL